MGTIEIFESGFVKAFISVYFEYKIHSYYPDKDRLLYVMCNTEAEKIEVTNKQIEYTKSEIKNLGREDLSFAYLLSSKAESGPNYIEPDKRFDFWLSHFAAEFQDNTDSFCPILAALLYLSEDSESDESSTNTQLVESYTDSDANFWEIFPKSLKPKNKDLSIEYLVKLETEIEDLIKFDINEFIENGLWDFDFEEYENFIESNKVIQNLIEISELFVQLNRLDMFQSFLLNETNKQNQKPLDKIKTSITIDNSLMEREKVIARFLEAVDGCLSAYGLNRIPDNEYVLIITMHSKEFITALKELYFSDNKNKEEYYIVLHEAISKATFHINDDNFSGSKPDVWRAIIHNLNFVQSYVSELRFRETNNYFPFPEETKEVSAPIPEPALKSTELNLPYMSLDNYITLYHSNIDSDISNNISMTTFTADSLIQEIKNVMSELKPIRLDSDRTRKVIVSYIKKHSRQKKDYDGEIIYVRDTTDYFLLRNWLYKICSRFDSYYYAYEILTQYCNDHEENEVRNFFEIEFKTQLEVESALLRDIDKENIKNHSIPETGKRPNQSEKIIISTLKDFFIDKTNNGLIQDIQTQFNSYDGKRMAILIYLLQFEFKLIKIVPHSKTISRTQFIKLLKNNFKIKTQSIDKYFNSWNNDISVSDSDIEFIDIKEKLTKLIENKVV